MQSLPTAALTYGWARQFFEWDRPEDREVLLGYLALGVWLIVDVYPGQLTMCSERLSPEPVSRHGPLMPRAPEDTMREEDLSARVPQLPHHAIVIVGSDEDAVHYLDPWFPRDRQPFSLSHEDFFRMWTGQVVIPATPGLQR